MQFSNLFSFFYFLPFLDCIPDDSITTQYFIYWLYPRYTTSATMAGGVPGDPDYIELTSMSVYRPPYPSSFYIPLYLPLISFPSSSLPPIDDLQMKLLQIQRISPKTTIPVSSVNRAWMNIPEVSLYVCTPKVHLRAGVERGSTKKEWWRWGGFGKRLK